MEILALKVNNGAGKQIKIWFSDHLSIFDKKSLVRYVMAINKFDDIKLNPVDLEHPDPMLDPLEHFEVMDESNKEFKEFTVFDEESKIEFYLSNQDAYWQYSMGHGDQIYEATDPFLLNILKEINLNFYNFHYKFQ